MSSFLELVARDLCTKFPNNLHNVQVVFPSKRARLFFNRHLMQAAGTTVWAPHYTSIQELFLSISPYTLIDQIEAICLLYQVYCRHIETDETLDDFYGWGMVLLSDFDDIDKHLVNAHLLFNNIENLERATDDTFLSTEQEAALQHFFTSFSVEQNKEIRERFEKMWHAMPAIYDDFNTLMRERGCLTEGAIYRDVIEHLKNGTATLDSQVYAFVGLNALSPVEQYLLKHLQTEGRALFYWDYDQYYMQKNMEAGLHISRYRTIFPNALSGEHFDNMRSEEKHYTYISCAGTTVQTRYIPTFIAENSSQMNTQTAVVLCDENLLPAVLHALPGKEQGGPEAANITMGYPLASTPVYTLIRSLMVLHTDGYDRQLKRMRRFELNAVKGNPLLQPLLNTESETDHINLELHEEGALWLAGYITDILERVMRHESNDSKQIKDPLLVESLFQGHQIMLRMTSLMQSGLLKIEAPTFVSLANQIMRQTSIPFHGEPAVGLQIMGVLETRCLDFDNILLLSVGEGKLPKADRTPSFIPYSLRPAFGLTTIEDRTAVYAYYFYRLLQRARNINIVYDTSSEGTSKNEMSRFARQFLAEMRPGKKFPDRTFSLSPQLSINGFPVLTAEKTPSVMQRLYGMSSFSPSALKKYIACPLSYYFAYVCDMKQPDNIDDDMDSATFGNIFHNSAKDLYETFKGRTLTTNDLKALLEKESRENIENIVNHWFDELYFKPRNLPAAIISGDLSIRHDVIMAYLENLIRCDIKMLEQGQRTIVKCEEPTFLKLKLKDGHEILIKGHIDRMDEVILSNGKVRKQIIDYKTTSVTGKPKKSLTFENIFEQKNKEDEHAFQTFMYAMTECDGTKEVQPLLHYTQKAADKSRTEIWLEKQPVYDFTPYCQDFETRLIELMNTLFDTEQPFVQSLNLAPCTYCPFKTICGR